MASAGQVVGLLLCLFGNTSARAEDAGTVERRIRAEISQRHPGPDVPDFWRSLGPEAVPVLIRMYDASQSRFEKIRIIEGLGYFSIPEAQEKLETAAVEWKSNNVFRRQVAESQIRASSEPIAVQLHWLEDADKDVRAAALRQIHAKFDDSFATPEPMVWSGYWVSASASEASQVKLESKGKRYVVEVLSAKKEWISLVRDFSVQFFRTEGRQWLEIRDSGESRVFIGSRELKSSDVSSKERKHGYRVR